MKKLLCGLLAAAMLCGCTAPVVQTVPPASVLEDSGTVSVRLKDGSITVTAPDGMAENAVTTSTDIRSDQPDNTHTVVTISAPGTYTFSGKLELGQIAVDLGEEAKNDPNATVTLVLDGLDITCTVAPAIIFYNVYECGDPNGAPGANVVLAQGSENRVVGSHTEDFDGSLYSKMSLGVSGEGLLRIEGDNEGLCSEKHLTIDGGELYIESGNDGINANEDGVSVVTVNAGRLWIAVGGGTGEGDGIDSNGSIVINGGHVEAYACGSSMDGGLDADQGVQINGGTVIATGSMLEGIGGSQTFAAFTFAETQQGLSYTLKNQWDSPVLECQTPNDFSILLLSSPELTEGNYSLFSGDTRFEGMTGTGLSMGPQPIERPDWPGGDEGVIEIPPQPTNPVVTQGTVQPPQGEQPENMPVPDFSQGSEGNMPVPPMPEGDTNMPTPQAPNGVEPPQGGRQPVTVIPTTGTLSDQFPIQPGANYFSMVQPVE